MKVKWKKDIEKKQCVRCGTKKDLTLHHLIPRALGGDNDLRNLIVLCKTCHNGEHINNNKKVWEDDDLYLLMWMKNNGFDYTDMTHVLKRTRTACQTMVHNCKLKVDNVGMKIRNNFVNPKLNEGEKDGNKD